MQNVVTIILPISREEYLSQVFSALEMMDCNRKLTNLIAIVDGDEELFVKARNFVSSSKFNETLCVQFSSDDERPTNILERRERIAKIHNELKYYIKDCKYILGIEDDTVVPPNTLKYLLEDYEKHAYAGIIQGVELGRHNKTYVGAWRADDIYEPTLIKSILPEEGKTLEEIDAGGMYCFLTLKDTYINQTFQTFENNGMGPDADWWISLRQKGYSNFIDWRIKCTHLSPKGNFSIATHKPVSVGFRKNARNKWIYFSK